MLGSNAKAAFGFVGVPLVVADEPGAYETIARADDVRRYHDGTGQAGESTSGNLHRHVGAGDWRMVA